MKNKKALVFAAMGFELVGIIISSVFIGQILDEKLALKGFGIVGLSLAGLTGWIVHIVLLTKGMDQDGEQ